MKVTDSLLNKIKILIPKALLVAFVLGIFAIPSEGYAQSKNITRVKLGEVTKVFDITDTIVINASGTTFKIKPTASTTVYFGDGTASTLESVTKGSKIYVFGIIDEAHETITAEKIVVKNPSKLSRKDHHNNQTGSSSALEIETEEREGVLSFWVQLWKGITFTTAYGAEKIENGLGYFEGKNINISTSSVVMSTSTGLSLQKIR